jgi:hypothetical protein
LGWASKSLYYLGKNKKMFELRLRRTTTVVLTLNPAAPENGIIFSLPQAVPAGQIKSFAIPQQRETIN